MEEAPLRGLNFVYTESLTASRMQVNAGIHLARYCGCQERRRRSTQEH
jgi:hypothetical protein